MSGAAGEILESPELTPSDVVDLGAKLADLAKLPPIEYDRRRKAEADALDIRVGTLDDEVERLRAETEGPMGGDPDSVADELVRMVRAESELFHGEDRTAYASFLVDSHRETWPLESTGFREWLGAKHYRATGKAPSDGGMAAALSALSGIAKFDGPEMKVWLRVAKESGRYYLDLCNDAWQAVEISPDGWQVLDHPPVRFRRNPTMRPLPLPEAKGDLSSLWEFVNVVPDDQPLFLAAIIEMYRPETDFIVMEFIGEQGSGKSDTQERVRDLVDPSVSNLRPAPKEREDIFVAAANNWCVSFNNLSHLSADRQDALCTLSTGGGFASRTLYTNGEETVWDAKRPVMLNGISTLATAQDLIDRTLRFDLPEISEASRRPKSEMLAAFEEVRPAILGGLLDLFSKTLRALPNVKLSLLPRMADFAPLGEAMFRAMGRTESFVDLYRERRDQAALAALDGSPVACAVLAYMDSPSGAYGWNSTVKGLLDTLATFKHDGDGWPKSAKGLSNALRRDAPALRRAGVAVKFEGHSRDGNRVTIRVIPKSSPSVSQSGPEGAKEVHDVHQVHRPAKSTSAGEHAGPAPSHAPGTTFTGDAHPSRTFTEKAHAGVTRERCEGGERHGGASEAAPKESNSSGDGMSQPLAEEVF